MLARRAAANVALGLLAFLLAGCGTEEKEEVVQTPCLGSCYTETATSTTAPVGRGDHQDLPGDGGDGGGDGGGGGGTGGGADETLLPVNPTFTMPAVRRCYLAPLYPGRGCQLLERLAGGEDFGLNLYGQETTAKRACLEMLRAAGGDTFVFAVGQCELWNCSSPEALKASAGPPASAAGTVAFATWRGTVLSVGAGEQLDGLLETPQPPELPPARARFELVPQPEGKVALRSASGMFVTELRGGALSATAALADLGERFELIRDEAAGTALLRAPSGKYLSVLDSGAVLAAADADGAWERFGLITVTSDVPQEPPEGRASEMEVFSERCDYQAAGGGLHGAESRAPVIVKLWEWSYDDVARECAEYLGPNGFDAVQISPVAEHILGAEWWTKYKPVSYGLDSRSGSRRQFVDMVAACRAAGVQVLVDVILNHMADPCEEGRHSADWPCTGYNGTRYGNRRSMGSRGWDAMDPSWFHHHPGREMDNCGVGPETGYLCGSSGGDLRDCSCCACDLFGLPDLDTGLEKVRAAQTRHLFELHDIGVTMARVDAALYQSAEDLSAVLHGVPWDTVYQEWWGERPVVGRTADVGLYRDVSYRWKIANGLYTLPTERLPEILRLDRGVEGLTPDISVYPTAFHDGRSNEATADQPTYKLGLAFHQAQKFLLAWPRSSTPLIWSGFGWSSTEQGPPGCEIGQETCAPSSPFDASGEATNCLATPTATPLPEPDQRAHRWICEHRWEGVAGLVAFRRACRGKDLTHSWAQSSADTPVGRGQLAFRLGEECFAALVRGDAAAPVGDWDLASLATGLPEGRYCDLASLPARWGWDRASCPREVTIDANGIVTAGAVRDGDLLAIHAGARLADRRRLRAPGAGGAGRT